MRKIQASIREGENRLLTATGFGCLLVTLLLMSTGVRVVRADPTESPLMSIDPKLVAAQEEAQAKLAEPRPGVAPSPAVPAQPRMQPGVAGVEIEPGIILLNNQGYNYVQTAPGGGDQLDPKAIAFERRQRQPSPGPLIRRTAFARGASC